MASNAPSCFIDLREVPETRTYSEYLANIDCPIFLAGQSVTGECRIITDRKFDHKGISVKLIGQYRAVGDWRQEFEVSMQQIAGRDTITREFSAPFTFDRPRINYPSYHGFHCSLSYFVVVEIKVGVLGKAKRFHQERIAFLDPIDPASITSVQQKAVIQVSQPPICFEILMPKTYFAMDEDITGTMSFGKVPQVELQAVSLWLVLTERVKQGSETKSHETVLIRYEVIDGCPRPNVQVPFAIQLAPMKLWVAKSNYQSVISTSFRIDVYLKRNDATMRTVTQPIQIYQRFVNPASS